VIRGIGLRGAVAVNVITMIGIGPLITIPLVLGDLHGSLALAAWVVGALIALCDGLVWAELGSLYPGSGGTYVFLREIFGRDALGRLLAFLFAWQIVLAAPLVLASGYIGFAHYAGYLWPPLASDARLQGVTASAVGVVTLFALYRPIGRVAAFGLALAAVATATLGAVIVATATHFDALQALGFDRGTSLGAALAAGLGPALVITLYDYYGYGAACTVSDEVREPARTLPRSVVLSILVVGALYVALQLGVLGVVSWRELVATTPGGSPPDAAGYVASLAVERTWGAWAARAVTLAILVTAFASTYGNLLAYSRIPYAAATDGVFLRPFARLHARSRFPHVALLAIGLLALPPCFLSLGDVINALTTGLVIIQSLAQIAALAALRARRVRAPYRMALYPLPAIVAAAGWIYIFCSAGRAAIAFGLLSLAAGGGIYVWRAKLAADWPFIVRTAAAALALTATFAAARPAAAAGWGSSALVEQDGESVLTVDAKPFFIYGAAFFYERLPRSMWRDSMLRLRYLGVNSLDLYVPWNWHELADGDFDFDGRTSPRRDLHEVLRLARELDFKILLRPGPVIRNEWRNGGYPAWLLQRREYGMPLHDLLEGRYPPTATLQNTRSDDAAAQWMRNATHMTYARRWLERVLHEFDPAADLVIAVQLDDDQGAYLDNQTWPAPHLTAYLRWLAGVVHGVTGPAEPVFINSYQMKVTASSPVWTTGNWYQSEAYAIGEHDRAQLEFSTGLLGTRPDQPIVLSEFQAGWLEQPDDIRPRPADPANTALALATIVGAGGRGVVNFPAQDTLYPSGMEAPFANAFYSWDAALRLDGSASARAVPTRRFGQFIAAYGSELAGSSVVPDAGIVYATSMFDSSRVTEAAVEEIAAHTIETQQNCRRAGLVCRLVDLRYADDAQLARLPMLVVPVPALADARAFAPLGSVRAKLERYRGSGHLVVALPRWPWAGAALSGPRFDAALAARALHVAQRRRIVDGLPGAVFARAAGSALLDGFLSYANYDDAPLRAAGVRIRLEQQRPTDLALPEVAPRAALLAAVNIRLHVLDAAFLESDRILATDCPLHLLYPATHAGPRLLVALDADHAPCFVESKILGRRTVADVPTGANLVSLEVGGDVAAVAANAEPKPSPQRAPATLPIRGDAALPEPASSPIAAGGAIAYLRDVFEEGADAVVLQNASIRVVIAPRAGGRAFVFEDLATHRSVFTSVGALRDDVAVEPPLSTADRIAVYTHEFPAGTFNRPYRVEILESGSHAVVRLSYAAPDVVPRGARFVRTVSLLPDARTFAVDESATFAGNAAAQGQRAVSVASLAVGSSTTMSSESVLTPDAAAFAPQTSLPVSAGNAFGFADAQTHELATVAWRAGDVERVELLERRWSLVARLTFAPGRSRHVEYGYTFADSPEAARALLERAADAAQGPRQASANTGH
jgi:amino acid transporter